MMMMVIMVMVVGGSYQSIDGDNDFGNRTHEPFFFTWKIHLRKNLSSNPGHEFFLLNTYNLIDWFISFFFLFLETINKVKTSKHQKPIIYINFFWLGCPLPAKTTGQPTNQPTNYYNNNHFFSLFIVLARVSCLCEMIFTCFLLTKYHHHNDFNLE